MPDQQNGDIDMTVFYRNEALKNVFKSINHGYASDQHLNLVIKQYKELDSKEHFSVELKNKFGLPLWDIAIALKNGNGLRTIFIPFEKKYKDKELLLIAYFETENDIKFRLVDNKQSHNSLPKTSNKEGSTFTKETLNWLFKTGRKNHAEYYLTTQKNQSPNPVKSNSTIIEWECWYSYGWGDNGDFWITNTQCRYAVRVVQTFLAIEVNNDMDRGGGGGGGSYSQPIKVYVDPSIANNPSVNCVYENLLSDTSMFGLKSLIEAFEGETGYNLDFSLKDIPTDGKTHPLGNGSFEIWINRERALDEDFSRIWLASSFLHEAFHAQLRQKAFAVFGNIEINNWPKNIDDMTLRELSSYVENRSKSLNLWNGIMHEYMANHINILQSGITSFVKNKYPSVYSSISNPNVFRDLALMGLEETTIFAAIYNSTNDLNYQYNIAQLAMPNSKNCPK
ncbi:MAG: hypothetical protein EAZ13_08655 [Sphingobacteriia bacterium]|nr:MAG: hypothetical protein EAZ41_08715 [Sphingobacteriia bacterium]TAH06635.1 MAG: hypothetical protein EAZ13_08655 [Sphingobacteriia bacterium]